MFPSSNRSHYLLTLARDVGGINDGIKSRTRMINLLKTVGYRTYSDGVGATNAIQSPTKDMQVSARMKSRSLNISHWMRRF